MCRVIFLLFEFQRPPSIAKEEPQARAQLSPTKRLFNYLCGRGVWDEAKDKQFQEVRSCVLLGVCTD